MGDEDFVFTGYLWYIKGEYSRVWHPFPLCHFLYFKYPITQAGVRYPAWLPSLWLPILVNS